MTKKHFEKIAETIKHRLELAEQERDDANTRASLYKKSDDVFSGYREARIEAWGASARVNEITDMASALARGFWDFNHNFDNARFLAACGIE